MSRDLRIPHFAAGLLAWAVALTLVTLLPSTAGAVVSNGYGFAATDGQFPWTVAIVPTGRPAETDHFCGGTLIAPDRVLTAAHCIDPGGSNQATASSIEVVADQASMCAGRPITSWCVATDVNSFTTGQRIAVSSISLHPNANVDHYYDDVALLTLAVPVTDPTWIMSLVTAAGASQTDDGTEATADAWGPGTRTFVAGWGLLDENDWTQPNVMHVAGGGTASNAKMPRLPDSVCGDVARLGSDFRAQDMLCVGSLDGNTPTPDACQGDSGGPLLKPAKPMDATLGPKDPSYWRLVGVVSWGVGCAEARYPGVYARVGAPEIHDYALEANPPSMPLVPDLTKGPTITGKYAAGGSITCHAGTWVGAAQYEFSLFKDKDGNGVRDPKTESLIPSTTSGTDAAYGVQTSDLASPFRVGCKVTGRGVGGYAAFNAPTFTDLSVDTSNPQQGGVTPSVTPTPTPTVFPDKLPPVISKSSSVCSAQSCRVALVVLDRGSTTTTAGIASVSFSLYLHRRGACSARRTRRTCVKTVVKMVHAKRSIDQYVLQLSGLKPAERPKLRTIATDKVGNRAVLSMSLKLRTGR